MCRPNGRESANNHKQYIFECQGIPKNAPDWLAVDKSVFFFSPESESLRARARGSSFRDSRFDILYYFPNHRIPAFKIKLN